MREIPRFARFVLVALLPQRSRVFVILAKLIICIGRPIIVEFPEKASHRCTTCAGLLK
jgi:hypothetical protein